ncbi:hypothetical protein PPACK8108_LOCUS20668 [Phakopsora pachyrhizi]|uniref:Uncharacterized protein n=1 Tax=Phakopsora pachyrhizi TaxID=170000 RepID=A0AAV0BIU6_PHAPC|nr:hypothetical protein PPACK8108_LOCUS20668 [Phakopsora pachyrhizi]
MTRKQPPSKQVKLNTEYEQDSPDQPEALNNPTPSTSNICNIRTRFSTRIRSLTIAGRARILQTLRRSARIRNRSSGINNSNGTNEKMNDVQVEESTKISNGKGKQKAEEIEEGEPMKRSMRSSSGPNLPILKPSKNTWRQRRACDPDLNTSELPSLCLPVGPV